MFRQRLRFILIRLQRSSFAELIQRIQELALFALFKHLPSIFQKSLASPKVERVSTLNLRLPSIKGEIDKGFVEQILQGKLFCLNQDPESIHNFEAGNKGVFFSRIRSRAGDPDIRVVWEPGRLQHLMILMTYLKTEKIESRKGGIKEFVKTNLMKWLGENSFPHGPHYMSVMECGLRIPVFLRALIALDNLSVKEHHSLCQAIYHHGWLIRKRLSLYSSLGNHTVAECLGLVMAGAFFGNNGVGREWLQTGIRLLGQEVGHQILDDGGPVEQSLKYHRFVLDLYWLVVEFLEENNLHDCYDLKNRLQLGENYLAVFMGPDGRVPMIGDSDDGFAVAPGLHPGRCMAVAAVSEINPFPEAGYTVIRSKKGLRVIFDHGPLGMAPLYNHGHADALSLTLSVGEEDFLIDPGTFMYNGDKELRSYFKSTRAHNTVCIDGSDQAEQLTGFIWNRSYNIEWQRETTSDGYEIIQASHDGYNRLHESVLHQRRMIYGTPSLILLEDTFTGAGRHEFSLNFHLHPDVTVKHADNLLHLRNNDRKLSLQVLAGKVEQKKGAKGPLHGWFSPAYGILQETTTLHVKKEGGCNEVSFITLIGVDGAPSQTEISRIMMQL